MYINFVNKKQMKLIKKSLFEQNKMVFSWSWSCTEHTRQGIQTSRKHGEQTQRFTE